LSARARLLADIREWVEKSCDPEAEVEKEQTRALQDVFGIIPGEKRFFDLPIRKGKRVAKAFDKRIRGAFHELVAASKMIAGRPPANREEQAIMAAVHAMSGRYMRRDSNRQPPQTPEEESRRRIEHMHDLAVAVGTWVVNTPGGLADLLSSHDAIPSSGGPERDEFAPATNDSVEPTLARATAEETLSSTDARKGSDVSLDEDVSPLEDSTQQSLSGSTFSPNPAESTARIERSQISRRVTGAELGQLIRLAHEHGLNRAPRWRQEGDRAFIEGDGRPQQEIALDTEYVLVPSLLHTHRMGRPARPHWRCSLYVQGPDGLQKSRGSFLDVLVADFDALDAFEE
jgi:hypothetical protein